MSASLLAEVAGCGKWLARVERSVLEVWWLGDFVVDVGRRQDSACDEIFRRTL